MRKRYLNILLISILLNIENNIKYKDMKLGRNLKQPKVGEHYFVASNDYQKTKIEKEVVVTSVGRKYFTVKLVDSIDELKFSKADFSHNNGEYSSAYFLYNDVDDYEKKGYVEIIIPINKMLIRNEHLTKLKNEFMRAGWEQKNINVHYSKVVNKEGVYISLSLSKTDIE